MHIKWILSFLGACLLPVVVNACVGDPVSDSNAPRDDGGSASNPPARTEDAGTGDASTGDGGTPFCETVAGPGDMKETVFCEDFETPHETRWESSSDDGTLTRTDFEGSMVLDVTMNAASGASYAGPRLFWPHIPAGGSAEVSFDFMLLEGPSAATGEGLVWFARIGALEFPSLGFGSYLAESRVDHVAILGTGTFEEPSPMTFSFAPKAWTRVTLQYTGKPGAADLRVSVGTNTPFTAETSGAVELGANDYVFLGAFAEGNASAVKARFDNVVIRVKAP